MFKSLATTGLLVFAFASVGGQATPKLTFSLEPEPVVVTVTGQVLDKRSGQPVSNARVGAHIVLGRLAGPEHFALCPTQQTYTDADGRYKVGFKTTLSTSGPRVGRDILCVYADAVGYETQPQYVRPALTAASAVQTVNFSLDTGRMLRGVVVNSEGQPVGGALVRVQNSDNGDWNFFGSLGRAITAEDGSFQVGIGASDANYLASTRWLCIVKPGVGALFVWDLTKEDLGTLSLNPGGRIAGRVVDVAGAPVPNCEVSARIWPCDLVAKSTTDQDGNYTLRGVPGEPSIADFFKKKNGRYDPEFLGQVEVHARPDAQINLKDAPHCKLIIKEGQSVTAPPLVVGADTSVAGRLLPSRTALSLGGLLVRLDGKWENMVEADLNGYFRFPYVPPGKRTFTAYLPFNLRYDRGIGQVQVNVQTGTPVKDLQIQLLDLAEVRVQYLDAKGNPLPGVTAAATWSKNGDGAWTEGTVSDEEGWAVLYLYPDAVQYIGSFDRPGKLAPEEVKEVDPQPGQVLDPVQIVMLPTATITGRLLDAQGVALGSKTVLGAFNLADGTELYRQFKTEPNGTFRLEGFNPAVVKPSFEIEGTLFQDPLGRAFEIRPGQVESLGDIALKTGLNTASIIREKHAHALDQPQEITQAASDLFDKIRKADYDYFLKPRANWQRFPIVGFYQTHQWFDNLVVWMSASFKTNPIANVELGKVFACPKEFNGQKGLPSVPYRLTLKDGSTLQGDLPFEYNFDGNKGHWHGLEGIDWHLQQQ